MITAVIVLSVSLSSLTEVSTGQSLNGLNEREFNPLYHETLPVCDCADLINAVIPNTVIESAVVNKADSSCRVTAIVTHPPFDDRVKVTTALPLKNWNGRYYGTGGGGFAGGTLWSMNEPVSQGFAAGSTDAGHEGGSGAFALDKEKRCLNWQEIRDFAYLGIHDMTIVGKALVKTFYGKPALYSYFVGGSNGGRQALTEAQRYPADYNGILALCPAIYWSSLLTADLWPQAVMFDTKNYVSRDKLEAVTKAVITACDDQDGLADGVIEDPVNCKWDPGVFVGKEVGDRIFTASDADVVRRIWEGPRSHDGRFLWYGPTRGTNLLALAGTNSISGKGAPFSISTEWVRYFLLFDPEWDGTSMTCTEFEALFNQSVDQYSDVFQASNTDLSAFRDNGSKLIILHGLADQLVAPQGTIMYYNQLQERMGGAKKTSKFVRLYLFPGLDHGFMGAGPKPAGQFNALVRWVEEGKAPEYISTELKDKAGDVIRVGKILPYSALNP